MEISFDKAIELLEIADISKLTVADIPIIEKKAKKRWHPDRVIHLGDPETTKEYTVNFQQVEPACQLIYSYITGSYKAGNAYTYSRPSDREEPEEIIRQNAAEMQAWLNRNWSKVKEIRFKWAEEEVVLSDGFKLRDLLTEDFKEDIALLSVISFYYGIFLFGILTALAAITQLPIVIGTVLLIWAVHVLACALGVAPLSRFWLPPVVSEVMIRFINFGLGIYHWAERQGQTSSNNWVVLLIRLPVLFGKLVKYVILFPLYELAKILIGDKVLGVVKTKVSYYAGIAEWYAEQLMSKLPQDMTRDELFDLSHLHSELRHVEDYVPPQPQSTQRPPEPEPKPQPAPAPRPVEPERNQEDSPKIENHEGKTIEVAEIGPKKRTLRIVLIILITLLCLCAMGVAIWLYMNHQGAAINESTASSSIPVEMQSSDGAQQQTSSPEEGSDKGVISESSSQSSMEGMRPDFTMMNELNKHLEVIADAASEATLVSTGKQAVLTKFQNADVMVTLLKNGVAVEYMTIVDFLDYIRLNHYRYKITNQRTDGNGRITEASVTKIN